MLSNPIILRTKVQRYLAIGFCQRFVTVIFEVKGKIAFIITAYPSSEAQRKLYKSRRA